MIRFLIKNNLTIIDGNLDPLIAKSLHRKLGYRPENSFWMAKNLPYKWDGITTTFCHKKCTCPIKDKVPHFPSGLLSRAWAVFDEADVPYEIEDIRPPIPYTDRYLFFGKTLRDYQEEDVITCLKRGRGIYLCATGAGKTTTASAVIARMGVTPFIFFVTSTDLLRQAHDELSLMIKNKDGTDVHIGMVGGGHKDIQDITIMTVQSAVRGLDPDQFIVKLKDGSTRKKKVKLFDDDDERDDSEEEDMGEFYKEVKRVIHECKGMYCDEVQHWRAKTCQTVTEHATECRYRFGMSATPFRDAGDDILIESCFGKIIGARSASYLIDHKYLVPPTIYFVPIKNMKKTVFVDYAEAYELGIVRNNERNQIIAKIAKQMSDNGRQILILVKHIAHGELLEEMIPEAVFLHGKHSPKQRKEHLDLMRQRKAKITIASAILDEGVDVRPQDALILAGSGKSSTRALQRIGRVIRPYECDGYVKKDAVVVDFDDHMKWMDKQSKARKKMYRTEERFVIKEMEVT